MATRTTSARKAAGARAARLAQVQMWLGFAVTAAIAVLQSLGLTRRIEYPLYDLRSRVFNVFTPPPSNRVALIAIDDQSIDTIGRWPWPRELLGHAIRELKRAGATVIALDILHHSPQPIVIRLDDNNQPINIDNDARLAAVFADCGRVVQGTAFGYGDPTRAATEETRRAGRAASRARFEQVMKEVGDNPEITLEDLMSRVLPGELLAGPSAEFTALQRDQARSLLECELRSSIPVPPEVARWFFSNNPSPPIPSIGKASAAIASVSFAGGDPDGTVRRIPLWVQHRGRLFPSLGLAATALHLGVWIPSIRATPESTELFLLSGEQISIPSHAASLREIPERGDVQGLLHVAWPRGGWGGWEQQFAEPVATGAALEPAELSLGRIVEPSHILIPRIRQNIEQLDTLLENLHGLFSIGDQAAYAPRAAEMRRLTPDHLEWRKLLTQQRAAWLRALAEAEQLLKMTLEAVGDPAGLSEEDRAPIDALRRAVTDGQSLVGQTIVGIEKLNKWRDHDLPALVKGRICFIGWTATGSLADFVRTSIDSRTPGVHVHAAVANAILNSVSEPMFLASAPPWMDLAAVVALGILGTMIGVRLGVVISPAVLVACLLLWFLFDGLVFWDFSNLFVVEACPMAAAFFGWLTVILHRLLVEQRSRRQTEARFRSYVSGDVVDILVNNPRMDSMRPQKRELTIFFSDIAGWTTIAERLGTEGVAKFLATYLKAMTDILQENRATIDKYLGDGIMAFWGAPIEDPHHAKNAVTAVLKTQERLREMNESGAFGPAGAIAVRTGLSSGEVNVGDFGNPPYKSAYTVIGDSANLAARLEAANKQFGTSILMTERTRALAGMESGVRLIGRIVVKGKTEPETIWEPIGTQKPKGERTPEWIRLTTEAVEAYIAGDFERALGLFERLETEFNDRDLATKYREAIRDVRELGGPGAEFAGTIVLSEK